MDCMKNRFNSGVLLNNRYQTLHELNHGSFGMVFKARDVVENKLVALKCLTKPNTPGQIDDGREELVIHQQIGSHPNIVELIEHFETPHHVFLVLEFCSNGDLFEAIHAQRGPKQTEKVREMMLQLIEAIEYMHSRGVAHRDIKPENIFLSDSGIVKLGDFGLATLEPNSFEAAVGSDRYMAPEQFDPPECGYDPTKADVWALGICLLNILFGKNPFNKPVSDDRGFRDYAQDRSTLFDVFDKMSQDAFNVLTHCLALDPESRSLEAAKEAVKRLDFFTTDDESMDDDFLMNSPPKVVTANREPLRTPSISSPQLEQGGAFPWSKALAINPPIARQLSAIPDEGFFPFDEPALPEPPVSAHTDNSSIVSFVDSGLGVSLRSSTLSLEVPKMNRSEPVPISSPYSLPTRTGKLTEFFRKRKQVESKSWSDLVEDDDDDYDFEFEFERVSFSGKDDVNEKTNDTPDTTLGFSSDGSDTPRAAVRNLTVPADLITPVKADEHHSEPSLFDFEQHTDAEAGTVKLEKSWTSKISDKWQALGDRRRAYPPTVPATASPVGGPVGSLVAAPEDDNPTPTVRSTLTQWNRRYQHRVAAWRKPRESQVFGQGQQQFNQSAMSFKEQLARPSNPRAAAPTQRQEWSISTNWRRQP